MEHRERAMDIEARLVSISDIRPVLTSKYLVKGWLDRGGLSMLYGPSTTGKTFVALDLALHVAAGLPWMKSPVKGGPVLYIAAEGGLGIRNRLAAIKQERPEMANAPFSILPTNLDLHADRDALALCGALPYERPALVVVDTLARSMGKGDENAAKDASQFVRNCDLIRRLTGAHVMVIHHTGKDAERGARGSYAFKAAVDDEIEITKKGEIINRKARDRKQPDKLHFTLRQVTLGTDEDGDPVTSAVVDASGSLKTRPKPLKGAAAKALRALKNALDEKGAVRAGNQFPHNRKVVGVKEWREACAELPITSGDSDSAPRIAFNRAIERLLKLGYICVSGDHVWLALVDEKAQA